MNRAFSWPNHDDVKGLIHSGNKREQGIYVWPNRDDVPGLIRSDNKGVHRSTLMTSIVNHNAIMKRFSSVLRPQFQMHLAVKLVVQ